MIITAQNFLAELEAHVGALSQILQREIFTVPETGLADQLAKEWTDKRSGEDLKANQLRRFFHAIKQSDRDLKRYRSEDALPDRVKMNLLGIMPELAYARGRKLIPNKFYRIMKACLRSQSLVTVGDFRLFMEFLTAVLAYHKFREKSNQES